MKKVKKAKAGKKPRGWLAQYGEDLGLSAAGAALYQGAKKLYSAASDAIKPSKKPRKKATKKAIPARATKKPTQDTKSPRSKRKPTRKG